ncbi:MAG: methyltransferase domain-containing protein [Candidatus Magasanikbacteria bacterium]
MSYHSGNNLIDSTTILEKSHVHESMHVVDFGCGRTGHIVFSVTKAVGEKGIVYAVDILKDVLESIRRRSAIEAIHNVETIWGDIGKKNGVAIAPKTIDIVFCINVLFHFFDYDEVLNEATRLLKDKGRIVIVDWQNNLSGIGPKVENMVDFDKIIAWARQNNFFVQEDTALGNYHRGLFLYKNF